MCHPDFLQKDWHSIYTTSTHILLPICKVSKGDGQKDSKLVIMTHKIHDHNDNPTSDSKKKRKRITIGLS